MFVLRTRPAYSEAELKEVYDLPWEMNPDWDDHRLRRRATLEIAEPLMARSQSAADLSCGDAHFAVNFPEHDWHLGDFAPGHYYEGPIEETIEQIPDVDVFFLCETLEHLDDPGRVLEQIRQRSRFLVLSTPLKNEMDDNPQHYWAWDDEYVLSLVREHGWEPLDFRETDPAVGYVFQVWALH